MGVRTTAAGFLTAATLLMPIALAGSGNALAQSMSAETRAVRTVAQAAPSETSTQNRRRRPRVRIYREDERGVYPRYNPGPDAVRDCTATYVQEFRPSGTVIVPHMSCYWRHS